MTALRNGLRGPLVAIGAEIVDSAVEVHRTLGPGLLERIYQTALAVELRSRGLRVESEVQARALYKGHDLGRALRLDLVVEGQVVIEVKATEDHHPIHEAQLLTYLKITGQKVGYVLNFGQSLMKDGITRMIL